MYVSSTWSMTSAPARREKNHVNTEFGHVRSFSVGPLLEVRLDQLDLCLKMNHNVDRLSVEAPTPVVAE